MSATVAASSRTAVSWRTAVSLRARALGLPALLLGVGGASWAILWLRMGSMGSQPGADLGAPTSFMATWTTMMAAMMLPALAIVAVRPKGAEARSVRRSPGTAGVASFVLGYLGTWAFAGLAGYALVETVGAIDPAWLAWRSAGRYLAAGAVLAAGLYQLTPAHMACLRRCCERGSLGSTAPTSAVAALRAGVEHGASCTGCCWALMVALYALGMMSLAWMAFVTALIAVERLLGPRPAASRGVAALLCALALAAAVAPGQVFDPSQPRTMGMSAQTR